MFGFNIVLCVFLFFFFHSGMTALLSSVCWNILAHKADEVSETNIRIYQRPTSNDVYEIRATKEPPFCRENENQDAAW